MDNVLDDMELLLILLGAIMVLEFRSLQRQVLTNINAGAEALQCLIHNLEAF